MANDFKTSSYILDESIVRFYALATICKFTYRRFEQDFSDLRFPGSTISYRIEEQTTETTGNSVAFPAIEQRTRNLTIDQRKATSFQLDGNELTLDKMNDQPILDDRIGSHIETLAAGVDTFLASEIVNKTYLAVGNAGQAITSQNILNKARGAMNKMNIPLGDRYVGLAQDQSIDLANSLGNYFNNVVNQESLMDGIVSNLANFNIYETIYLGTHIAGVGDQNAVAGGYQPGGAVSVNSVEGDTTITVNGLQNSITGVFLKGDVIELRDSGGDVDAPGIFNVAPKSHQNTNITKTFVVTADVDSSGTGVAVIPISPAIEATGNYKNISRLPIIGDTVFIHATHDVGIAYANKGIVYAQVPLKPMGTGVTTVQRYVKEYNSAFTYSEGSNITDYANLQRLDILYGGQINPEYCFRVISKPTGA